MKHSISHDTTYRYADEVRASIQYLRLTPCETARQKVLAWRLDFPEKAKAAQQLDPYGNVMHVLTLDELHQTLVIHAEGRVEIDESCECEPDTQSPLPFLRISTLTTPDDALRDFVRKTCGEQCDRAALITLMDAVRHAMPYKNGVTRVDTRAAQAFALGAGVCQDHAHVFVTCARLLGVPARYVSGYLLSDEKADELVSHAWAEAWFDGAWYSFDVTNGLSRPERHLKLAVGLDYLDACSVRGMCRSGGQAQMQAQATAEEPVAAESIAE